MEIKCEACGLDLTEDGSVGIHCLGLGHFEDEKEMDCFEVDSEPMEPDNIYISDLFCSRCREYVFGESRGALVVID